MDFGVPLEAHGHEHRVGLNPFAVSLLTRAGCRVYVQHEAGLESYFRDEDYAEAGATIVFDPEEVYQRSDVVCRVGAQDPSEMDLIRPGSTICAFHHFAVRSKETVALLAEKEVTLLGWEIVEDAGGRRPLLTAFSEIAGTMVVHVAAHLLGFDSGGRGITLGGVPGIPPATVAVLGAGTLGRTAAARAAACGAHVIVLDADVSRLREVMAAIPGSVVTALASHRNLERITAFADVVVGAVLIPGARAPYLVTEEMVKGMKDGSIVLDLSIDQGGCVETSRPTHPDSPTYRLHGVIHYCVPNMTANVPRTASRALAVGAQPFLTRLAELGVEGAVRADPGLARGLYMYRGRVVQFQAAAAIGVPHVPLEDALAAETE